MAFRLYLVPIIGVGTQVDPRRPKYLADGTVPSTSWGAMDYGMEPWMLVGADLAAADDLTVTGQPDAFGLPFNLSATLTAGQVTTVQNKLEAINLPADWVNTTFTWLRLVRMVLWVFHFLQRFTALNGPTRLFGGTVTLSTTISQLPAPVVANLQAASAFFSLDTSSITGASTIRQVLIAIGTQLAVQPQVFDGVSV